MDLVIWHRFNDFTALRLHLAGEWWNADTEKVIQQALQTGGGPNVSDAYTINGFPGSLYNSCSIANVTSPVANGNCHVFTSSISTNLFIEDG